MGCYAGAHDLGEGFEGISEWFHLIHEVAGEVRVETAAADQALARFHQRSGTCYLEACAICYHQQHVRIAIASTGAF
jgi:hypothetical protein